MNMIPPPAVERALHLGMQHARRARPDNEEIGMSDYETVSREYRQVQGDLKDVGVQLKGFVETTRSEHNKFSARLQDIEQRVLRNRDDADSPSSNGGIASGVLAALEDDHGFQGAAHAASRNQKVPAFVARASMDASIRQALVGGGSSLGGTNGYPTAPERGGIVGPAQRPLRLLDVLPSRPVTSDAVEFVRLSLSGAAAEQEDEGDEKAELGAAGDLVRVEIGTIAGWLAASRQVLADNAALRQMIDRVLRGAVTDRLEARLVAGYNGVAGRISGLLEQSTPFTPAESAVADRIGEAISSMTAQGYAPTIVVLHPTDWFALSITRSLPSGEYLFGPPTAPVARSLWNLPVVLSDSVGLGGALVIDTAFVTLLDREQMSVMVSNSHKDFFTRNFVAILCELRAGLEVLDLGAVVSLDLGTAPTTT